jgi:hypothetical protein
VGPPADVHHGTRHRPGIRAKPRGRVRRHLAGATGKASTMFNTMRQVGVAIGVALLTTAIVLMPLLG